MFEGLKLHSKTVTVTELDTKDLRDLLADDNLTLSLSHYFKPIPTFSNVSSKTSTR